MSKRAATTMFSSPWRNAFVTPVSPGLSVRSQNIRRPPRSGCNWLPRRRSEEHTSELQSLMRISYAVFCLKKKKNTKKARTTNYHVENTKYKKTKKKH